MEFVEGKYYLFVKYSFGESVEYGIIVTKENGEWKSVYPCLSFWTPPKEQEEYREISPEEMLIIQMS